MNRQGMGSGRGVGGLLLASLLLSSLAGCGSAPPPPKNAVKKAPVSGTVTLGGQPLEGADVYFFTDRYTGFGKTNSSGKFELAQGAAVGSNKVFISKFEGGGSGAARNDPIAALNDPGQAEAAGLSATGGAAKRGPKQLIPPEYSDQLRTKLTFDVPEGGAKDADFRL